MLEQLRVVWLVYSQRRAFQRFVILATIWLVYVVGYTHYGGRISATGYFGQVLVVLFAYALAIGYLVRTQFVSWRSRLLPRFAAAHFIVALGLSVFLALILFGVAWVSRGGFSGVNGQWQDVSILGILIVAWSFGLVMFAIVYFSSPVVIVLGLILAFIFGAYLSVDLAVRMMRGVSVIPIQWFQPPFVTMLALLNVFAMVLLVRRMMHMHEELREFRFSGVLDPREVQKRAWSENRRKRKSMVRLDAALDRIPKRLGNDVWSQMKHFQRVFGVPDPPLVRLMLTTAAVLWVSNVLGFFNAERQVFLLSGLAGQGGMFQWIQIRRCRSLLEFMLPLSRKEILTRYGAAMLFFGLRVCFGFVIPFYFVAWMPIPGTFESPPSIWPFVASIAFQFPVFGIVALLASRRRGAVESMAKVATVVCVVLSLGLVIDHRWLLFTISASVMGSGLIAWSYRRWLQFEFN